MFKSLMKLTEDVFDIATTPVKIAIDTTRIAIKPVAEISKFAANTTEEMADDLTEDMEIE